MAKRKARTARSSARGRRKSTAPRRSAKRPTAKAKARSKAAARKTARKPAKSARSARPAVKRAAKPAAKRAARPPATIAAVAGKVPRLDRARRTLGEDVVPTPPSSLNMDRHGSAARTGRAELADLRRQHHGMNELSAGDADVDVEDAFFTGEEAPGGDNPTPDQDIVDDIGKALGVEYADSEELKAADKVGRRDRHRWELDPASAEDYKDRD